MSKIKFSVNLLSFGNKYFKNNTILVFGFYKKYLKNDHRFNFRYSYQTNKRNVG